MTMASSNRYAQGRPRWIRARLALLCACVCAAAVPSAGATPTDTDTDIELREIFGPALQRAGRETNSSLFNAANTTNITDVRTDAPTTPVTMATVTSGVQQTAAAGSTPQTSNTAAAVNTTTTTTGQPPADIDNSSADSSSPAGLIAGILIAIIVVVVLLALFVRSRKAGDKDGDQEAGLNLQVSNLIDSMKESGGNTDTVAADTPMTQSETDVAAQGTGGEFGEDGLDQAREPGDFARSASFVSFKSAESMGYGFGGNVDPVEAEADVTDDAGNAGGMSVAMATDVDTDIDDGNDWRRTAFFSQPVANGNDSGYLDIAAKADGVDDDDDDLADGTGNTATSLATASGTTPGASIKKKRKKSDPTAALWQTVGGDVKNPEDLTFSNADWQQEFMIDDEDFRLMKEQLTWVVVPEPQFEDQASEVEIQADANRTGGTSVEDEAPALVEGETVFYTNTSDVFEAWDPNAPLATNDLHDDGHNTPGFAANDLHDTLPGMVPSTNDDTVSTAESVEQETAQCLQCGENKSGRADEAGTFYCNDCWKQVDGATGGGDGGDIVNTEAPDPNDGDNDDTTTEAERAETAASLAASLTDGEHGETGTNDDTDGQPSGADDVKEQDASDVNSAAGIEGTSEKMVSPPNEADQATVAAEVGSGDHADDANDAEAAVDTLDIEQPDTQHEDATATTNAATEAEQADDISTAAGDTGDAATNGDGNGDGAGATTAASEVGDAGDQDRDNKSSTLQPEPEGSAEASNAAAVEGGGKDTVHTSIAFVDGVKPAWFHEAKMRKDAAEELLTNEDYTYAHMPYAPD